MGEPLRSVTAVIHLKLHYGETEERPPTKRVGELVAEIVDRADQLSPEMQELILKFGEYMKQVG